MNVILKNITKKGDIKTYSFLNYTITLVSFMGQKHYNVWLNGQKINKDQSIKTLDMAKNFLAHTIESNEI